VRVLAVLEAGLPNIREDEKPGAPWHIPFHQVCDLPELLVRGNERA
jgi:hypothetical protein